MKKLLLFLLCLPLLTNAQTTGRAPYAILNQVYRGDTLQTKMQGDTVYYHTTKDVFEFDKPITINGETVGGVPDTIPADKIQMEISETISDGLTEGEVGWDGTYKTITVAPGIGGVVFQIGQELVAYVRNNSGATIPDGKIVYVSGAISFRPTIALADNSDPTKHQSILGFTTMDIPNNSNGFVTVKGNVNGLNTSGYNEGDLLYLTTAGNYSNVPPIGSAHRVEAGFIIRENPTAGTIFVKINDVPKVSELSGVSFTEPDLIDGDIMVWNDTQNWWDNVQHASTFVSTTYSQAVADMAAGDLVPGATYEITDRGDRGIYFTAITTSQFAKDGTRRMLCPATYETDADWIGVWNSGKTASIGDHVIWGAQVWENQTGVIGTSTNDTTLDATNWTKIPKWGTWTDEYIELTFGVNYDWDNDYFTKQWDDKGNIITFEVLFDVYNGCNITDWNLRWLTDNISHGIYNNAARKIRRNYCYFINNNGARGTGGDYDGQIYENNTMGGLGIVGNDFQNCYYNITMGTYGIYNNINIRDILNNNIAGSIRANEMTTPQTIENNRNNGDIYNNTLNYGEISFNTNNGNIQNNTMTVLGSITKNTNNGSVSSNTSSVDISDVVVNK